MSFCRTGLVPRQVSAGEMNRIKVDEVPKVRRTPSEDAFGKIFDHVDKRISEGDTALYGRVPGK